MTLFAPRFAQDEKGHRRMLADAANAAIKGELNTSGRVTVATGTTQTTITDARMGYGRLIVLVPLDARGAILDWWVASMTNGVCVIGHALLSYDADFAWTVIGEGAGIQFGQAPAGSAPKRIYTYEDIAMGLQAAPNAASAPALGAWNGGTIQGYVFAGSGSAEQLFGTCEYNHSYAEGADIYPHIHWAPTTTNTGNIKWNLTYVWHDMDTGPSAEATISVVQAASGTAYRMTKSEFPAITGTGKHIGSQIVFRIWRNSADAADTFTGGAFVQTFGIHALIDSSGSVGITSK
jgi:hypothetical protein